MGFWFALFLLVASSIVSALLAKHPKDAVAAGKGEFNVPTAQEGRAIPVVFGTVELKGPNVFWWGNLSIDPIKKKSGGFLGIGAKKVTVGYKYFMTMALALCHGQIDALIDIVIGDKGFANKIDLSMPRIYPASQALYINAEEAWGGEDREGGVVGHVRFHWGDFLQSSDPLLDQAWGGAAGSGTAPAWRGMSYATFTGYIGTSQYIKNWAFIVRRCPTPAGFDSGKANISGDANPAHMVYEILTSQAWGLGLPPGRFDISSFTAAASTLYTEGFGMSIILDSDQSADAVIADIMRTIDGVLYTDPATGLWTLKLARFDYTPAALTEFTTDDFQAAPEWSRGSWSETLNEIKVEYIDRSTAFSNRVVQAQETANFAVRGEVASESFQFLGISNAALALKIAMRELKTHSYPLAQFRMTLNRKAWNLRPGAVFKATWNPPTGPTFTGMVLRVTSIRYGALEAGAIEVEAVEDIFAVAATAYTDTGGTGWTEPLSDPAQASYVLAQEAPYHLVGADRYVMVSASRGDAASYKATIWTLQGGGYVPSAELDRFTPSAPLTAAWAATGPAQDTTGFTVTATGGWDVGRLVDLTTDSPGLTRGDNLAYIDGEWVSWKTCTDNGDGTYTFTDVLRGVLDTVPVAHALGARVWFVSEGAAATRELPFTADQSESIKVTPRNPRGEAAIGGAAVASLTTVSRAISPYPPGNVKVNGVGYSAWLTTSLGDETLTWSPRDRVTQGVGGLMVAQDSTGGGLTQEGTVTVEVLVGGTVKQTFAGLTGPPASYTATQRVADDPDGLKPVTYRIKPINGALTGTVRTTPGVIMTGFGMTFGKYFGGVQS